MRNTITTFSPKIYQESIDNVVEVLSGTWIGTGPMTEQFEDEVGTRLGLQYPVALSSCTVALEVALAALGIGTANGGSATDEVITTPLTFVATNNSILRAGAIPVFVGVEEDTYNIRPDAIKAALTRHTKAAMVVHLYGHPADMEPINKIGIPIIEDCAHAFGAKYNGMCIGEEDDNIHCYSFQATKNLTTGGGGLISVPTEWLYNRVRKLRWFGVDRDTPRRAIDGTYDLDIAGGKGNMTDINAAIGIGQLQHIEDDNAYRGVLVNAYMEALHDEPITLPVVKDYATHAWHAYTVRFRNIGVLPAYDVRELVLSALAKANVRCMVLYKPHSIYNIYKHSSRSTPDVFNIERPIYNSILTLPLHMNMGVDDVEYICGVIKEAMEGIG